jgi:hypothetical protein
MSGVLVFAGLWLLSAVGLLAIARIRGRIGRGIVLLVLFAFTFFGVAFEYSLGTQLNYDNLAIAWEARVHGGDAIGFYGRWVGLAFLVSAVGCAAVSVSRARHRRSERTWDVLGIPGAAGVVVCLPFLAIGGLISLRGGNGSDGLPIQYKAAALFAAVVLNEVLTEIPERRQVESRPVKDGIRSIVLIVDESVRGDYASNLELLPSLRVSSEGLDLSESVIIYTSDHGQNLLENGSQLTHCSVDNSTVSEGPVPLMTFSGNPVIAPKLGEAAAVNRDRLSHFHVPPSLVEMMGFPGLGGSATMLCDRRGPFRS